MRRLFGVCGDEDTATQEICCWEKGESKVKKTQERVNRAEKKGFVDHEASEAAESRSHGYVVQSQRPLRCNLFQERTTPRERDRRNTTYVNPTIHLSFPYTRIAACDQAKVDNKENSSLRNPVE